MRKQWGRIQGIFLLLLFAVLGCSQSTEPPADNKSVVPYLPLQPGNWWIFKIYATDSAGQPKPDGYVYVDSTAVTETMQEDSRQITTLLSYWRDTTGKPVRVDTSVIAFEAPTFWIASRYSLQRFQNFQLPLPEWIPFANFTDPNWQVTVVQQAWTDTIEAGKNASFITDSLLITASREGADNLSFHDSLITAPHFRYRVQIFGQLVVLAQKTPLTLDFQMHTWYARNIGVLRVRNELWMLRNDNGTTQKFFTAGEEQRLLRYHVALP